MTYLAPALAGEIAQAPILMALALVVAFLGAVGVGVYVFRHTPERFASAGNLEQPGEATPRHAA